MSAATPIEVVTNERYARADTSVTGQTLKIIAARPDAVITGGSGTPGALPYLALAERGYKGGLYGTHALINPDFVRVGGRAVEGVIAPTGPVIVAEQLPDSNPTKKVSLAFREVYQKANNARPTTPFPPTRSTLGLCSSMRPSARWRRRNRARRNSAKRSATPCYRPRKSSARTASTTSSRAGFFGVDERARVLVQLKKEHGS